MKNLILFAGIFSAISVFSQDTIVYKTGESEYGKLIAIDNSLGLLEYKKDGESFIVALSALESYTQNSAFSDKINLPGARLSKQSGKSNINSRGILKTKTGFEIKRFAVSSNVLSLLSFSNSDNLYFNHNSVLTLEPEILITEKYSIRIPVLAGLTNSKDQIFTERVEYVSGWYYDAGEYPYSQSNPPVLTPENDYYYTQSEDHPHDIIYQIGLYPRYYPWGINQYTFYISTGLSYGVADMYAIDYYHTLSWNFDYWYEITDRKEVMENQFSYFRFETMMGLMMNISKSIGFSGEAGITSSMKNKGILDDRVFNRVDTENYTERYAEVYDNTSDYNYTKRNLFIRINFIYRFGKPLKPKE